MPYSEYLHQRSFNRQSNYIYTQLSQGADVELQANYPEGYQFANAIFSIALIEHADNKKNYSKKTASMVDKSIMKMSSSYCKNHFQENLELPFGAFYNGWLNFTIKKYRESPLYQQSEKRHEIDSLSLKITNTILSSQESQLRVLDSYSGSSWPADNLACIASLPKEEKELISSWLETLQLVSKDKLLHHSDVNTEEIRGSSQALTLYFLGNIDNELARKYEQVYRKRFIKNYLSLQLVKEHENERTYGDIDSGPVIFGFGSVATIMNIKAQCQIGNSSMRSTRGLLNMMALPTNYAGEKFYLFQYNLMFDIFMLWINT